ncbi:hypothetical protein DJ013_00275 [Arcticibacterium luteifluviistationis]|uniref:Uncharacterized protein n=1 Tax=Arcticibacterium luteifluviistationis TaxID=1784714 RepID=A0A2Z4G6D9_9BACT|nr:hypothetical protein DJ013_00275 [Arcticibacterium luteifluviistationis]
MSSAKANDSVNVKSNIYLSSGSEFNFKVFMNKNAKRFVKKNNDEWATFNNVVRLYNNQTGSFLKLSEEEKAEFSNAVASINTKLANMKGRESQIWLTKVDVTEKVFNFLWSNKVEEKPLENIYEIPTISVEATVGR